MIQPQTEVDPRSLWLHIELHMNNNSFHAYPCLRSLLAFIAAVNCTIIGSAAAAWSPGHIVIVIEENHSLSQVIGSSNAPYINGLAQGGMLFTSFFAITHPSQPNYLQFFSGSHQGVFNDALPAGTPWQTDNLAGATIAAGSTFAIYSEDLPGVGSNVNTFLNYARKHNPCVNWQNATPRANQIPPTANRPFFSSSGAPFFGDLGPSLDYNQLPAITIVVPNLQNDMHDGSIAQADAWLSLWISGYANWCRTHDSLLIITWDEDNAASRNRIPTIFYGEKVLRGECDITYTLHNLLHTIEEFKTLPHAGSSADVRAITGAFVGDPSTITRRFQQGSNGYFGAVDTYLDASNSNLAHDSINPVVVDGSPLSQGLIRFDAVFGEASTQVPVGATILSAKLSILTGSVSGDGSVSTMNLHRMLIPWQRNVTWNSIGNGITADGLEANPTPDFSVTPNVANHWVIFDVTSTIESWSTSADPAAVNRGWAVLPTGTDGWRWTSCENKIVADRPMLEITFRTPCIADIDRNWTVNIDDLLAVITAWGTTDPLNSADVNHDHVVNIDDLLAVITAWGACS
jgi:hypothetical protein